MTGFSGFEPCVGEIRAIRTFRVGPDGALFPLFGKQPWTPGTNTAQCVLAEEPTHVAPDPDCTCGLYAYADQRDAGEYPYARYVLAVVACWGRVIAGTRGLRAQHARIVGLWLSPQVPHQLADSVTARHPEAARYEQPSALLAAHPLTELDTYQCRHTTARRGRRIWTTCALGLAVVAGAAPSSWIARVPLGWCLWGLAFAALLLVTLTLVRRPSDPWRQRRRLLCIALLLWMVAPLAGPLGVVLLRLPLVQIAGLVTTQRVAMHRLARTFPAPI